MKELPLWAKEALERIDELGPYVPPSIAFLNLLCFAALYLTFGAHSQATKISISAGALAISCGCLFWLVAARHLASKTVAGLALYVVAAALNLISVLAAAVRLWLALFGRSQ